MAIKIFTQEIDISQVQDGELVPFKEGIPFSSFSVHILAKGLNADLGAIKVKQSNFGTNNAAAYADIGEPADMEITLLPNGYSDLSTALGHNMNFIGALITKGAATEGTLTMIVSSKPS